MILHRCFAWDQRAGATGSDGPLWFPRVYQGEGRHDNPDRYGCLYLSEQALSTLVEQLARFRGQRLLPSLLRRRGLPLALAHLELDNDASRVATRQRSTTQPQARLLHARYPDAAGLKWWSTYESLWMNVTVFDRAAPRLRVVSVRSLTTDDPAVVEAADFFGLRTVA